MLNLQTKSLTADVERERLTSLINSMADGVIATDDKVNIILYNGAALNILDMNTPMQGMALSSVVNLTDKNNHPINVREMVVSAKTPIISRDIRIVYKDNNTINLYMSIAPVRMGYGKEESAGYVIVLRDISREKSLEEERDEFISVVSHELRTPVAIAEGNVSNAQLLVEKGGDLLTVKEALRQTHNQISFLAGIINDLATLSRAERGRLTVELENINVHDLLNELANSYLPEAAGKGLKIDLIIDPNLTALSSSKLYVREILQNFITNAIKYTEHGVVTLTANNQPGGILFEIHDTGIGISKQDQTKIFSKFFRSEDYRTRKNNGTGLGLYVTLKLANLLHAKITLDSELNKGSKFKIYIPNLLRPKPPVNKSSLHS